MPMEATEPRQFRKTAIPHTANTKRPLRERQVKCTPQMGARRTARRVNMATALRSVRPPTVTSTQARTGTRTRTPEAAGAETRTIRQNPPRLTQETPPLPRAGEDRIRVADRQPSAAPAAEAGIRDRRARAVLRAWAVAVAGADAAVAV